MANGCADMADDSFWSECLADVLPAADAPYRINHVRSRASKAVQLTRAAAKADEDAVHPTTHLVVLTAGDVHVYALEALVYDNRDCTTVFVAKADSTGYGAGLRLAEVTARVVRALVEAVSRPGLDTRVCLFARAQAQYLFPNSAKNKAKHVLGDRQLIRWWARALTPVLAAFEPPAAARLMIPGESGPEVRAFFPPRPADARTWWDEGEIFGGQAAAAPALQCVPFFPDDPKSRFLESLIAEHRAQTSARQFFLELETRQEFRLGFVVGLFGVAGRVVRTRPAPAAPLDERAFARLHECMTTSDYATRAGAANATAEFAAAVPAAAVAEVRGRRPATQAAATAPAPAEPTVLGAGLVRRKPTAVDDLVRRKPVNTLDAGLVRRKDKDKAHPPPAADVKDAKRARNV
ncbi:histone acetylation protein-domain-containing protein [Dipodascopsis tothii]|uniref:histone acetylation protein-domain-containing protein n=1 Tax=Dipodascopsis tothii TaxID=44089 RepID=UPI0034D00BAB